jgi:hypothetical protein
MVRLVQAQEQTNKMIIKEENIILYRQPAGFYDFKSQAAIDELKKVFDDNGDVIHTKTITVEWETTDINWFAGQHIEKTYPIWKQSNIIQAGGSELTTMTTFIDAVRAWSNEDPLPDPWDGTLEAIVA